jgi:hypothetical protein
VTENGKKIGAVLNQGLLPASLKFDASPGTQRGERVCVYCSAHDDEALQPLFSVFIATEISEIAWGNKTPIFEILLSEELH